MIHRKAAEKLVIFKIAYAAYRYYKKSLLIKKEKKSSGRAFILLSAPKIYMLHLITSFSRALPGVLPTKRHRRFLICFKAPESLLTKSSRRTSICSIAQKSFYPSNVSIKTSEIFNLFQSSWKPLNYEKAPK